MANYYDEYRNDLYNPDDGHDTKKPGRNANWKAIQKGFKDTQSEIDRLDGRVDGLEERVETAEEHVANLEERVTNEEAFNREQQVAIDANTAKNTEQDNRLDGIDDAIERIDAKDAEQDGRLDALEESQDAQDVLIREHGNRLTAHDASIADINTRISRINAKDDEQDAAIADINAKDTEQDSAISDLADDVQRIDDSVNRVATDPATSRSTRIGNNSNNLTVSAYTENETKSMDFIDNVNEDKVQFGFLENDTGHMVTYGNLNFNFDDIVNKNNTQDVAITALQDKVRRTATDPATSRSTRIGSDTNNLTIATAKDAEGMSVQITDNADNDPIRVGFESDAGGDSIIIGNNSYKLGESDGLNPTLQNKLSLSIFPTKSNMNIAAGKSTETIHNVKFNTLIPNRTYSILLMPIASAGVIATLPFTNTTIISRTSDANGEINLSSIQIELYNTTGSAVSGPTSYFGLRGMAVLSY